MCLIGRLKRLRLFATPSVGSLAPYLMCSRQLVRYLFWDRAHPSIGHVYQRLNIVTPGKRMDFLFPVALSPRPLQVQHSIFSSGRSRIFPEMVRMPTLGVVGRRDMILLNFPQTARNRENLVA